MVPVPAMPSDNARGAIFMTIGMAGFVINDALMKLVAEELPLFQAIFLRGSLTTLVFALIAWRIGALRLPQLNGDRWLIVARSLAECGATFFFLTALMNMPLATVTAILQAAPLTIALSAAVFLREPLGWRRFLAIVVGFVGVLLIVRPGPEGIDVYAVYALVAVCFATLRDLLTRRMPVTVPSMLLALSTAGAVTLFAGLGTLGDEWVRPSQASFGLLGATVVFILLGYLLSIMAMRVGELGVIAPFRYTGLLWALVLGLFVFGDWPDGVTQLGAALIVGTGIFTLYRERRRARDLARARSARAVDNPSDSAYTAGTRG